MAQSWADRNAQAQSLGYRNYYDYRVHDYGNMPPGEPGATGELLDRLRGHRGAADLGSFIERQRDADDYDYDVTRAVAADVQPSYERDAEGRWTYISVTLLMDDGTEREYRLRGLDTQQIQDYLDDLEDLEIDAVIDPYVAAVAA